MSRPRPSTLALSVLVGLLVLGGCGRSAAPTGGVVDDGTPFGRMAAAAATAWRDAGLGTRWSDGFVPLEPLTVEPLWIEDGTLKASFYGGWIRTATFPDEAGSGVVRFPDGSALEVPLVGARTAVGQLPARSGDCPTDSGSSECRWVTLTAARLGTTRLGTSRGEASVPAWLFTVEGLSRPLVRVAVAPAAVTSLPELPAPGAGREAGIVSALYLGPVGGTTLGVDVGTGSCDTDPRGLVAEYPDLVVVGGAVTTPAPGTACDSMLVVHRVEVHLHQPLGTRPVIDAVSGQPLRPAPTAPSG
ncbi:MAG: hypothetical protein IE926_11240 [Micrococcales bacterium]|nr:hypothetical protein [Micrococcales bacterium]